MHYLILALLILLGVGLICIGLANRFPAPGPKNPCDCPGCEIERRWRNDAPLKPERDRMAKGGHRA